ncbi:MAG TPA: LacI family DNA-binding transcriptional regulator [Anaerolineales bacterium]
MNRSPGKPSPTIYDVAKTAGVSIATVSRVLNEPQKVYDETRATVLEAIERLGYVPKAEARARAMQQNRRIGVITPYFTAPSFVQRLRGVASVLKETRYELVIYTVESSDKFNTYLETLSINHYLDGLIILSLQFDDRFAQRLVDSHLETVLVEYPHQVLSSVEIEDAIGGKLVAEYLVAKGHRHLGFVGDTVIPEFGIHPITMRLAGFRQKLAELDIPFTEDNLYPLPYDVDKTNQAALRFLRQPDRPTAIFAATDLQAIAVLKAARELGIRVPQDLAIVGFDDLDIAEYVGLTTVRQHLDESGKIAAELLLSRIADPTRPIQHIQLPLEIVERETV